MINKVGGGKPLEGEPRAVHGDFAFHDFGVAVVNQTLAGSDYYHVMSNWRMLRKR